MIQELCSIMAKSTDLLGYMLEGGFLSIFVRNIEVNCLIPSIFMLFLFNYWDFENNALFFLSNGIFFMFGNIGEELTFRVYDIDLWLNELYSRCETSDDHRFIISNQGTQAGRNESNANQRKNYSK